LKVLEFLINRLKNFDFEVLGFEWDFNRPAFAYIALDKKELELVKVIRGPPVNIKSHCEAFKSKHDDVFEKDDFLYARVKREFVNANFALKNIVSDNFITQRVANISFKLLE
jgi:tRNA nucleotidyltransferase (CCA-adding enzyme)